MTSAIGGSAGVLLMLVAAGPIALPAPAGAALEPLLAAAQDRPLLVSGQAIRARQTLARFYAARDHRPAWGDALPGPALAELLDAIAQADTHGLNPADYHFDALRRAIDERDRPAAELLATDAYLMLGAHLLGGRLDPVSVEPDWTAGQRERDLAAHLSDALETGRIAAGLDDLAPHYPDYRVLRQALALYRAAADEGGWEPVASGPALKRGERGPRVAALRRRLQATGLMAGGDPATDLFDDAVEIAVAAFQRRIGLDADGVVGPVTLHELNKGPAQRIDQIRANLERWRWLPEDLGRRHVRVNIADYRLEARSGGAIERVHDVIVGRTYRKTPVFSGRLAYLVLNPWWETPHNLARLDKLPAFRKDPASVSRLGFEVLDRGGRPVDPQGIDWSAYSATHFPFRLRQKPGPLNALGQVKLMFPNRHNVYLHDTPSRELFGRAGRAFSSGCIRVADALGLAEWVLADTRGWSRERIDAVVVSGRESRVDLAVRVPVHILYFTAVAEADGALRLVNDVYERDARVVAALASPPAAAD